jgi:phenylacetate-CoA ligase
MTVFIAQCENGNSHINPEYGLVELLNEQGNHVRPGEAGELVCTGFLNTAMPLIRYRIGDSAVLSDRECGCGRPFPVVESLLGRTDDMIVTPEGRYVGRLDPVFKGLSAIKESQIVQESLTRIVVRVVREPHYTPQVGHALIAALRERLGNIDMVLEYVDAIPRSTAGKFRSVVSMISSR